jgi:hypothetical protein
MGRLRCSTNSTHGHAPFPFCCAQGKPRCDATHVHVRVILREGFAGKRGPVPLGRSKDLTPVWGIVATPQVLLAYSSRIGVHCQPHGIPCICMRRGMPRQPGVHSSDCAATAALDLRRFTACAALKLIEGLSTYQSHAMVKAEVVDMAAGGLECLDAFVFRHLLLNHLHGKDAASLRATSKGVRASVDGLWDCLCTRVRRGRGGVVVTTASFVAPRTQKDPMFTGLQVHVSRGLDPSSAADDGVARGLRRSAAAVLCAAGALAPAGCIAS